jgi:hypothetical protein
MACGNPWFRWLLRVIGNFDLSVPLRVRTQPALCFRHHNHCKTVFGLESASPSVAIQPQNEFREETEL